VLRLVELLVAVQEAVAAEDAVEVAVGAVAVEEVAVVAEVPSSFPSSSSDYLLYVALDII